MKSRSGRGDIGSEFGYVDGDDSAYIKPDGSTRNPGRISGARDGAPGNQALNGLCGYGDSRSPDYRPELMRTALDLSEGKFRDEEFNNASGISGWVRRNMEMIAIILGLGITGLAAVGYSTVKKMSDVSKPTEMSSITLTGDPKTDDALICVRDEFERVAGCKRMDEAPIENCSIDGVKTDGLKKGAKKNGKGYSIDGLLEKRDALYGPDGSPDKWMIKQVKDPQSGKIVTICTVE